MIRNRRKSPEHFEQSAFFRWLDYTLTPSHPEYRYLIYAVPNGGKRNIVTAMKLKAEGVRPGVFDVNVDIAAGTFYGMKIEFKAGKNKLTEEQLKFFGFAQKDYYCCTVYSWQEAAKNLVNYLQLNIEI